MWLTLFSRAIMLQCKICEFQKGKTASAGKIMDCNTINAKYFMAFLKTSEDCHQEQDKKGPKISIILS